MWVHLILTSLAALTIFYVFFSDSSDPEILRGKRVVITGASRGLGEQLAYHYARLGAHVFITARTEERLKRVVQHCERLGGTNGKYMYHIADMSDLNATDHFFKHVESQFGGVDILVLNHIHAHALGPWTGSPENHTHLTHIIKVNLMSYIHLTSFAVPFLEISKGQLIVINSLSGKIAQPYTSAYSATKAGLGAFFDSLRLELMMRGSNVSVTQVVLGLIGTDTAIQHMRDFKLDRIIDTWKPADPSDAASAIIHAALSRPWSVYFPHWECLTLTMIRDIIPKQLAYVHRVFYS